MTDMNLSILGIDTAYGMIITTSSILSPALVSGYSKLFCIISDYQSRPSKICLNNTKVWIGFQKSI